MKVCVTGGAGFIGSQVVEAYVRMGLDVVALDNLSTGRMENVPKGARFSELDIRNSRELSNLFEKEAFDVVNHHAAQISVPASVKDPRFDADVNIEGSLNLLEESAKNGVDKFIFASSGGTVYGVPEQLPCVESYPLSPTNPYGITKTATENYLAFYGREHGLRWTSLRYANVYGPRQDPYGEAGVVAIFCNQVLDGETVKIFAAREAGDGGCLRDYVYVEDVARANVQALNCGDGEAFNIGTRIQTKTCELVEILREVTGVEIKTEQHPPRAGDLLSNSLDPGKAQRGLNWSPRVKLQEGMEKTFAYFARKIKQRQGR